MAQTLRYALMGYGAWGRFHAQAIAQAPNAELTAILCRSEESAHAAQTDHPGVSIARDFDELLETCEFDAVDIVLPSFLHRDSAVRALDSGKHVLLEKPMATGLRECDDIIAAAARSGRQLSVGHEFRFSSQWRTIKDIIGSGDIGEILYCNISLFRFPYRRGADGWRYRRDQVGSWILEEPIHFLDLALWYFESHGKPHSIRAYATQKSPAAAGMYDNFTAVLTFGQGEDGVAPFAVVSQSLGGFQHHQVVEIAGSEGSIRSFWSGAADRDSTPSFSTFVRRRGRAEPEAASTVGVSGEIYELGEEIIRTTDAFEKGWAPYPPERGREVVALCLAAEESIRSGHTVPLGTH